MRTIKTLIEQGRATRGVPVRIKGHSPLYYVSHEEGGNVVLEGQTSPISPSDLVVEADLIDAEYTSVWDDKIHLTSRCKFDTIWKTVESIEQVYEEVDADALTDEYITLFWVDEAGVPQKQVLRDFRRT